MRVQPDAHPVRGGVKRPPVRLLLAAALTEPDDQSVVVTVDGKGRVSIARSASLGSALERMEADAADVVLVSEDFQDQEVGVFLSRARRAGFEGVVLRVASAAVLMPETAPLSAEYGRRALHFAPIVRRLPQPQRSSADSAALTDRQRAVLASVSQGMTNGQAAQQLGCTEGAVKATLQQIFKKLGVRKRAQLVRLVLERKLSNEAKSASRLSHQPDREHPLLLRSRVRGREALRVGDFVIDIAMHRIWVRGRETHLTPSEFELLQVFATHPGELVRNTSLCELFWRNPTAKHDSLRVLIRGLRAKIEAGPIPQYIVTERNFGYRFHPFPGPAKTV